jgi:hypothetical protein
METNDALDRVGFHTDNWRRYMVSLRSVSVAENKLRDAPPRLSRPVFSDTTLSSSAQSVRCLHNKPRDEAACPAQAKLNLIACGRKL